MNQTTLNAGLSVAQNTTLYDIYDAVVGWTNPTMCNVWKNEYCSDRGVHYIGG